MYLKSIEMQGFKSFANKMVLEFHNGITGIVGPNGSGKSNVADAVRWVLGEQRAKQLRGSSMQDVIFSGTELRKPLSYASVSITLDNSDHSLDIDYNEVTVTRRVYRSGESEYLLNGAGCRLKDIYELFYDTGIGKEGYSIIGQGQIDKILSGKPEDRRELFDEAAGIVKFKKRKATAQKKLEEEHNSIVRVNDIISELEKQKGPLERQSETAKIYLQKKDELKVYDVNYFLLQSEQDRALEKELEEKKAIAQEELDEKQKAFEQAKADYERLDQEITDLSSSIDHKRDEINEAKLNRERLEGQIELLKEQINTAKATDEHVQNRMMTIEDDKDRKEEQMEELTDHLDALLLEKAGIIKEQTEAEYELSVIRDAMTTASELAEKAKADIIELLNHRASVKMDIQRYDTMLENIQIRKAAISARIIALKSEQTEKDQLVSDITQRVQDALNHREELEDKQRKIAEQIESLKGTLDERKKQQVQYNSDYHRANSRLESLRNIAERYDGYGNSIRKVMDRKDQNSGIIGVVADLIKTDKEYELAIETALGGSIQNIVTDNENTAKNMISYLKEIKGGRATFLPLTSVKNRGEFSQPGALKEPGAIGLANKVVHTEDRFKDLIGYLLGKTLVVDNIDHALAIARKYHHSIRIVTKEGDMLSPGGSMSGGSFKNQSNLLGRRREIEDLEKEVQRLSQAYENCVKDLEALKHRRSGLYEQQDQLTELLQKQYLKLNTLNLEQKQFQDSCRGLNDEYDSIRREQDELDQQVTDITDSKQQIMDELARSEEDQKSLEEAVRTQQSIYDDNKGQESAALERVENIHVKTAASLQQENFYRQDISRLKEELQHLDEEYHSLDENLDLAADEIAEKQNSIFRIRESIAQALLDEQTEEEHLQSMVEEKEEKNGICRRLLTAREALSEDLARVDKELFRLNDQYDKLEERMEEQINYMWEEYGLTWSRAKELKSEDLGELPAIKKRMAAIKDEIKKLGNINVNAIEDYKELMERWEFMTGQRNDLESAENALREVINELDAGMRAQFREQFAAIQVEFEKAFRELFGGGKASLALNEDEDILESGIIINSQPPGKKLQNMMQLSGGEKALTAIALLFAIQNLKPSPFCLLDEIEAALDESNVGRFAGYLHKLTKNTQFIIITHRRGTMSAADRLYGITMQEKGVSALVSVDLIESDLDK